MIYDFSIRVANVLSPIFRSMGWTWNDKIPTYREIREDIYDKATRLITEDETTAISCGRIRIEKRFDGETFEGLEAMLEAGYLIHHDLEKLKKEEGKI